MPRYDFESKTQFELRDFAEENPDVVNVTIMVTPEEAAILLLANGVRQGIGVSAINVFVMRDLRRLGFIENIGAVTGRTACHSFTQKADLRLRFQASQNDEVWIALDEQDDDLEIPQWHADLELIAGHQAQIALNHYLANEAEFEARKKHTAELRRQSRRRLPTLLT